MLNKVSTDESSDTPENSPTQALVDSENTDGRQPLVPLSFKVTKEFKKRYQQAALNADMKLIELLSEMLDDWEKKGKTTQ
ncbi:hypothetical protein ACH50O_23150 (plasmid) [Methylomonas sp. 2BW1-5-20]|uniref:hypothetical protein n=1 Tax=Methylomonas sp. 2BW1-5-20 TaxID=3376686 RepID=UPI00404F9A03